MPRLDGNGVVAWVIAVAMITATGLGVWVIVRSNNSIARWQQLAEVAWPPSGGSAKLPRRLDATTRRSFEIASQPLSSAHAPLPAEASADLPPRTQAFGEPRAPGEWQLSEEEMPPLSQPSAELAAAALDAVGERDYPLAINLLQQALASDPSHPLLKRNLQMTLLNWGTADLNQDRPQDALERLQQADTLGDHPAVLRALGAAYLRLERDSDAVEVLESALYLQPDDGQSMFFLAQALTEGDRRPEALDLLLRAKELGMHGSVVDRLADRLSREVDAEWDYVRSTTSHFDIDYRDDNDPQVVAEIAATLEEAFDFVGARLDHSPARRTRAVLYPQEDFHHFTRMPDWISGVFDGRIKIPVGGLSAGGSELTRVIRHEYAHRLILDLVGRSCPVWLNEGIAMWVEGNPEFRRRWAFDELNGRQLLDLTSIDGPLASLGEQRAKVAYAQSYLAVEHLAERYGDRRIPELLAELAHGGDLREASRIVFRTDMQAVLATYFDSLTRE